MNRLNLFLLLILSSLFISAQESNPSKTYKYNNKGKLYVYWGWNLSGFSNSDIHLKGNNYDFTLYDVVAKDRPSPFTLEYFSPTTITIPQYNLRIGYFISDKYSISLGNDHMKYIMQARQIVKIDGYIKDTGTRFDKTYNQEDIDLTLDFLRFEHTDGLNYENLELRRHERLKQWNQLTADFIMGAGLGILYPKTNVTIFNTQHHDEFNVSGYAYHVLLGGNLSFRGRYFIQTELKGGKVNMPNISISYDAAEKADQEFYFLQYNFVFGVLINIKK